MPFLWEQCSQSICQRLLSESYRIPGTAAKKQENLGRRWSNFFPKQQNKAEKEQERNKSPFVFCHQEVSSVYKFWVCVCMFIFTELRQPCT